MRLHRSAAILLLLAACREQEIPADAIVASRAPPGGYPGTCGNSKLNAGEVCDSGAANTDAWQPAEHCNATCTAFGPFCGNGVVEPPEGCESTIDTAACDRDCSLPTCGDGIINQATGEACDDGHPPQDGDGCPANCVSVEAGWTCLGEPSACQGCGNNVREGAEECDGAAPVNSTCADCMVVCDRQSDFCSGDPPSAGCLCDGVLATSMMQGGGVYDAYGFGAALEPGGSAFITGMFRGDASHPAGFGATSLTSQGGAWAFDAFVVELNVNGSVAWARQVGSTAQDAAYALAAVQESSGGYGVLAVGTFCDGGGADPVNPCLGVFGATQIASRGEADVFVVHFDPDGQVLWVKTAGGSLLDSAADVATFSDGSFVVTGYYCEGDTSGGCQATFGEGAQQQTLTTPTGVGSDIFIARYNSDGTLAWLRSAGSPNGGEMGNGVAVLAGDSALLAVGHHEGTVSAPSVFGPSPSDELAAPGVWLAKYDSSGVLQWVTASATASGADFVGSSDLVALSDGSAVITGWFENGAVFGGIDPRSTSCSTCSVAADMYVERLDAAGSYMWTQIAQGNGNSSGIAIASAVDFVYVSGFFYGPGPTDFSGTAVTSVADGQDAFMARYNAAGSLDWVRALGADGIDASYGIAALGSTVMATGWLTRYVDTTLRFGGRVVLSGQVLYDYAVFGLRLQDGVP